jgi:hypothetical protein
MHEGPPLPLGKPRLYIYAEKNPMRRILVAAVLALSVVSCNQNGLGQCPGGSFSIAPRDTTIAAGSQFSIRVLELGCGVLSGVPVADAVSYQSSDTTVVGVGSSTGLVMGVKAGTAVVHVVAKNDPISGDVSITVQ